MNAVFFFKQKTAYEMRISDWSSDVCSSDLAEPVLLHHDARQPESVGEGGDLPAELIGLGLRCYGVLDEPGEPVQIAPVVLADEDGGDHAAVAADRTSVVSGTRVSVRVDIVCSRIINTKTKLHNTNSK